MREYEMTFIITPDLEQEQIDATIEEVQKLVVSQGGQVSKTDVWGRRRLAYPIRKKREGYYVVMQMQLPPEALKELDHSLKLNESILRYLIVRTDK
ncbi:MAG: 30S ribosomal protein S6 [Chloroflexi bacterium]|nr:MAG: 30S ribosomal protein S6 [Chloroflexota bacterium]HDN81077.1 30S ribosomal protein S6 [Chloroflexota bacterium]